MCDANDGVTDAPVYRVGLAARQGRRAQMSLLRVGLQPQALELSG